MRTSEDIEQIIANLSKNLSKELGVDISSSSIRQIVQERFEQKLRETVAGYIDGLSLGELVILLVKLNERERIEPVNYAEPKKAEREKTVEGTSPSPSPQDKEGAGSGQDSHGEGPREVGTNPTAIRAAKTKARKASQ